MLTGESVTLRPLRPDDLEPFWQARLDPLFWARTGDGPLLPQTLEAYREQQTSADTDGGARFAVEVGGELAGRGGLFAVDDLARTAELGVALLPAFQGRGHGRDVVRVLLGYAFRSRNLRRVHLQTLASNAAAVAAYLAVGFVEEGRLREHAWVEGRYDDVVLMAVLRSEWEADR